MKYYTRTEQVMYSFGLKSLQVCEGVFLPPPELSFPVRGRAKNDSRVITFSFITYQKTRLKIKIIISLIIKITLDILHHIN